MWRKVLEEGGKEADWANGCSLSKPSSLSLASTACTHTTTGSLVTLSVLFSSNFLMLYFAACIETSTMVSAKLREIM